MKKFLVLLSLVFVSGAFVPADAQVVPSLDNIKSQNAATYLVKRDFDKNV